MPVLILSGVVEEVVPSVGILDGDVAVSAVSFIVAVSLFKVSTFGLARILVSLLLNIALSVAPIPLKDMLPGVFI